MRMIGIGLMGFLLAGVALLLSTMNILEKGQRYVSELTLGPQLVFEDRIALPAADTHTAVVYRSNPNQPVILSGLPAYQGVAFNMPMDARPTSGYLQIDATLQVLEGVEGVLRISINNTRRGEMLLRPGEVGRSLQIPLSPTDFARDQLVVSFSLQGEGPGSQCSTDEGFAVVVEIETTSAVFLTLDRPLETPRDRVNAWGQMVRVAWPTWLKPEERARRLVLATQFRQRDIETIMVDAHSADALTTDGLREAMLYHPAAERDAGKTTWPRGVADSGVNVGLRRFHRKTIWRERYDLRQGDAFLVPDALDLNLVLGGHIGQTPWTLTVTLNGRLIHHQAVEAAQPQLGLRIYLPKDMQVAVNVIEVTIASNVPAEGTCNEGPELIAEMLPATQLVAGDSSYSDTLTELRLALSNIGALQVGMLSNLTAADAQTASMMLAGLLPAEAALKPSSTTAQVIVVAPQDGAITLPHFEPIWLVTLDTSSQELNAQPLEGGAQMPRTGMAILVIPNTLDLTKVAI